MSKELEAFDIVLFIEKLQCLPISMKSNANQDYIEMGGSIYSLAYKHFSTHYQPLLDAKDAEIATLKAVMEQARETLIKNHKVTNEIRTAGGDYGYFQGRLVQDCHHAASEAEKTIAAINTIMEEKP